MSSALVAARRLSLPLIAAGLLWNVSSARAEDTVDQQLERPNTADQPSLGPWDVTLGMGVGYQPRFEGAKRYHFTPIPYGSISYAGFGSVGPDGVGANIVKAGGFRVGVLVGYANGRDQSDDPHLQGLGNIAPSLEMGGYAAYQWNAFEIRAQIRQAVTHTGNGLTGTLGATYGFRPAPGWTLRGGPQIAFADSDHMKTFFSVTGAQSTASGLPAYTAGGGLESIGVGVNTTYQLSEHWLLFGLAKVAELVDDAADSPIVQSKEQVFTGAGLAYHF